jgi:hypothetical protein
LRLDPAVLLHHGRHGGKLGFIFQTLFPPKIDGHENRPAIMSQTEPGPKSSPRPGIKGIKTRTPFPPEFILLISSSKSIVCLPPEALLRFAAHVFCRLKRQGRRRKITPQKCCMIPRNGPIVNSNVAGSVLCRGPKLEFDRIPSDRYCKNAERQLIFIRHVQNNPFSGME